MGNVRLLQCKLIIQQPFIRDVYNFVRIHKTLKITPPNGHESDRAALGDR